MRFVVTEAHRAKPNVVVLLGRLEEGSLAAGDRLRLRLNDGATLDATVFGFESFARWRAKAPSRIDARIGDEPVGVAVGLRHDWVDRIAPGPVLRVAVGTTVVRGAKYYEGVAGGVRVLSDIGIGRPEGVARAAFELAAGVLEERLDAVLEAATSALRPLYNDTWRDDDAPELDATGFKATLKVGTVSVTELDNPSFLISLDLDCGDLFAGHAIEVMLDRDGRLLGEPSLIG